MVRNLCAAVAASALAACAGDAGDPYLVSSSAARNAAPSTDDIPALVAGTTAFTADVYRLTSATQGNLFLSPHSISTALAMTWAGARSTTASQLASALHFPAIDDARVHAAFNALDLALASRAQAATSGTRPFRLVTANSIWGQTGKAFEPAFLDTLAENYGTGLRVLDFVADPDGARGIINGWVDDRTDGKIQDLLAPETITPDTRLVLTNAITFSAAWDSPFDPAATTSASFASPSGPVSVPTLHQIAEYGHGTGADFTAVELPYDGDQLAMDLIRPELAPGASGDPLAALEASLDGAKLTAIVAAIQPGAVELSLPKFNFTAALGLNDTLIALGAVDAFSPDADFSGMDGTRDLAISDVVHKAFVAIDETGTEAAAATAVVVGDTSAPVTVPVAFDRPFLFLIRDRPTGEILFIGRVVDPR
ncbi:MAG: serpin family protein [Deltaproteobacteria bacterium]|nr:serpin family protein [Deltaproteobacteria bacterium]